MQQDKELEWIEQVRQHYAQHRGVLHRAKWCVMCWQYEDYIRRLESETTA